MYINLGYEFVKKLFGQNGESTPGDDGQQVAADGDGQAEQQVRARRPNQRFTRPTWIQCLLFWYVYNFVEIKKSLKVVIMHKIHLRI
jgi:hypothetical protein